MQKILPLLIAALFIAGCTGDTTTPQANQTTGDAPALQPDVPLGDSWATTAMQQVYTTAENNATRLNQTINIFVDLANERYLLSVHDSNTSRFFFNGGYYRIDDVEGKCSIERADKSFDEIEEPTLGFFIFLELYRERDQDAYAALLDGADETAEGIAFPPANESGELGGTFNRHDTHYFGDAITYVHERNGDRSVVYEFQYSNIRRISPDDVADAINQKIAYAADNCFVTG